MLNTNRALNTDHALNTNHTLNPNHAFNTNHALNTVHHFCTVVFANRTFITSQYELYPLTPLIYLYYVAAPSIGVEERHGRVDPNIKGAATNLLVLANPTHCPTLLLVTRYFVYQNFECYATTLKYQQVRIHVHSIPPHNYTVQYL